MAFGLLLFPAYYFHKNQQIEHLQDQIERMAAMLSQQLMSALKLNDKEEGQRLMQALRHFPLITYAELRDGKGYLFAVYQDKNILLIRPRYLEITQKPQFWLQYQQLNLNYPIGQETPQDGQLYIQVKLDRLYQDNQKWLYFIIALALILQLLLLPLWLWIKSKQLKPIYRLKQLFEEIKQDKNYSLRYTDTIYNADLQQLQQQIYEFLDEYENLQEKLNLSEQQSESANLAKSQFLITISNEIRSPMNGVLGITELLLDSQLNEQQKELGHIIHDSATGLLSILNDISEYSKIEAGQLKLYISQFDLQNLLKNIVTEFSLKANNKNITFHFLQRDNLPDLIFGDESRLQKILYNHLENAIKFTNQGEINFQVYIINENQQYLELGFSIRDTGVGIDRATLKHLFKVFTKRSEGEHKYGGTGLSMAINKKLCQMMDGDIHCHSIIGEGTTFQISLKFSKSENEQDNYSKQPSYESLFGLNVLLLLPLSEAQVLQHYLQQWAVRTEILNQKNEIEKRLKILISQQQYYICIYTKNMLENLSQTLQEIILKDALIPIFSFIPLQYKPSEKIEEYRQTLSYPIFPKTLYRDMKRMYLKNEKETQRYDSSSIGGFKSKSHYHKAHVLLIEDNLINQQVAKLYLHKLACSVDIFETSQAAINCVEQTHPYDLVLMNCNMTEIDHLAAHAIREKYMHTDHLPIIGLISHTSEKNKSACLETGIDVCITKPFSKSQLKQILDKWL